MFTWKQLAIARPDLARQGRNLFYEHGLGLGFLATVRADGGRSIAWLVQHGNRRVPYRGVIRNQQWLTLRVAALNLRRLLNLGLTRGPTGWAIA
jgi:hypothetical protein